MQLFMESSNEFAETKGLSFIEGNVISINDKFDKRIKLPSIGWYRINEKKKNKIMNQIKHNQWFYFVHSFMVDCKNEKNVIADYKLNNNLVTAIIKKDNITGLQFHPENSGKEGLTFLKNFCNE